MRAGLLFSDADPANVPDGAGSPAFAPAPALAPPPALAPAVALALTEDLRLDALWAAMARGDEELYGIARAVMLAPLTDPAAIDHRQQVLRDCTRNPSTVRTMHQWACDAVAAERRFFRGVTTGRPEVLLNRSLRVLTEHVARLRRLRELAAGQGRAFRSGGFTRLFASLCSELDDAYLADVEAMLDLLRFENGIIAEARLGPGNTSAHLRLTEPPGARRDPSVRRFRKQGATFTVPADNEENWRALPAFRDLVLQDVAQAATRSADHVRDFFLSLRDELGFYVGCLNLAEALTGLGVPVCTPAVAEAAAADAHLSVRDLRDPCLALSHGGAAGNDLEAGAATLIMVTGANRGGKSTFLRSVGTAQLMMQSGMFVAAERFTAPIAHGVFTHFRREEDRSMSSGKLDEELTRMSAIVDRLRPGALLLCNESFASTNEREAADIAGEILRALTELGVRVVFVTHLYELARRFRDGQERDDREGGQGGRGGEADRLFLTAERDGDGTPTFRIVPGEPSPTAFAQDLYVRVFGDADVMPGEGGQD